MKRSLTLIVFTFFAVSCYCQNIHETALEYAFEISDEPSFFTDKILRNANKSDWPVLVNYYDEITIYYSWTIEYDFNPVMISENSVQEGRDKTEYYIFDEKQNLHYYLMKYGEVEIVIKYVNGSKEFIQNTNIDLLSEWMYFIDVNTYFEYDNAKERFYSLLEYPAIMWNYPTYSKEMPRIESYCKNIDSDKNLVSQEVFNTYEYYKEGNLVKIALKEPEKTEYFIENGKLIYVESLNLENQQKVELYLFRNKVFMVIIDGQIISKRDSRFFENVYFIPMFIDELEHQLSK
ncbi:MAG: hypothetical protein PHH30_03295 [Bacteroidales bacterium]|nr:hypothetical protein [Bacteroidales bacterium]MDD3859446.1 hypothetical protein [Bacteroidales bacterium]